MPPSWMTTYSLLLLSALSAAMDTDEGDPDGRRHTNNWAVLVDSSRFWFNYRHAANVLAFYQTIKRLGIPDS